MEQDKFIYDIQAGEILNLKGCRGVWIYRDREETDDYSAQHSLVFSFARDKSSFYLHYESSELLHNAFEHYKEILKCEEVDVSKKPLKL